MSGPVSPDAPAAPAAPPAHVATPRAEAAAPAAPRAEARSAVPATAGPDAGIPPAAGADVLRAGPQAEQSGATEAPHPIDPTGHPVPHGEAQPALLPGQQPTDATGLLQRFDDSLAAGTHAYNKLSAATPASPTGEATLHSDGTLADPITPSGAVSHFESDHVPTPLSVAAASGKTVEQPNPLHPEGAPPEPSPVRRAYFAALKEMDEAKIALMNGVATHDKVIALRVKEYWVGQYGALLAAENWANFQRTQLDAHPAWRDVAIGRNPARPPLSEGTLTNTTNSSQPEVTLTPDQRRGMELMVLKKALDDPFGTLTLQGAESLAMQYSTIVFPENTESNEYARRVLEANLLVDSIPHLPSEDRRKAIDRWLQLAGDQQFKDYLRRSPQEQIDSMLQLYTHGYSTIPLNELLALSRGNSQEMTPLDEKAMQLLALVLPLIRTIFSALGIKLPKETSLTQQPTATPTPGAAGESAAPPAPRPAAEPAAPARAISAAPAPTGSPTR